MRVVYNSEGWGVMQGEIGFNAVGWWAVCRSECTAGWRVMQYSFYLADLVFLYKLAFQLEFSQDVGETLLFLVICIRQFLFSLADSRLLGSGWLPSTCPAFSMEMAPCPFLSSHLPLAVWLRAPYPSHPKSFSFCSSPPFSGILCSL